MALITSMVQGTDFRRFLDFVTPAFFDVMPARALLGSARRLLRDYRDREGRRRAVEHRADRLAQAGVGPRVVQVGARPGRRVHELDPEDRRRVGHAVLELYFHQLFDAHGPTLLNLGLDRCGFDEGEPVWSPGPGHIEWPEHFRASLERVYRSFYQEGAERLEDALSPLGLAPAADIFQAHFGAGDQRAVVFEVKTFVDAFHKVFVLCKKEKIRLDPAFLALGIYLATMYETLERVGVPLDVRGAFERVAPSERASGDRAAS